jgi:hypothetical protein
LKTRKIGKTVSQCRKHNKITLKNQHEYKNPEVVCFVYSPVAMHNVGDELLNITDFIPSIGRVTKFH